MNRKIDVDPFRGYPQPPPSSWLRIAFWSFIAMVLAMIILVNMER